MLIMNPSKAREIGFNWAQLGDFDIMEASATCQEVSRNVKKCRVLPKSLLGGPLIDLVVFRITRIKSCYRRVGQYYDKEHMIGLFSSILQSISFGRKLHTTP